MTASLRVNPAVLRSAGTAIDRVGADLSGMGLGQSLNELAGALPGFQTGAAGAEVGTALADAAKQVSANFAKLATNLQVAAEKYERTDTEQGKKIKDTFAGKEGKDDQPAPAGPQRVVGAGPQAIPLDQVTYDRGNYPSGPDAARDAINQALDQLGITDPVARQHWIDGYMTMALRESSYNPAAVNDWDINSKPPKSTYIVADGYGNGCSRGLVQCVPGTFARYHQPGTSNNIYDPVANVAASMNYVMDQYGVSRDGSDLAAKIPQANPGSKPQGY
ncbi:type VII secretion target [Mycobacterium shimoidei]|nr:type VII secretion target [Mycobacterium shimoidei]